MHTIPYVQWWCHACVLSAGLLLRLFHLLYNCDVVEEEVYHSWKEDITQDFPGKEKALFQVRKGRRTGERDGEGKMREPSK